MKQEKHVLAITFYSEERKRLAKDGLAMVCEALGCTQQEATWKAFHYLPLIISHIEKLDEMMPRPEMGLSIKTQLPHWRQLLELLREIKG